MQSHHCIWYKAMKYPKTDTQKNIDTSKPCYFKEQQIIQLVADCDRLSSTFRATIQSKYFYRSQNQRQKFQSVLETEHATKKLRSQLKAFNIQLQHFIFQIKFDRNGIEKCRIDTIFRFQYNFHNSFTNLFPWEVFYYREIIPLRNFA